jgi:iron complex transport system substrate-binding protein
VALLAAPIAARAAAPPRVVALDWGLAETLVALGHPPIGVAEIDNYRRAVVAPPLPPATVDVGLRLAPNPELMASLAPDLILVNAAQTALRSSLAAFGRVQTIPIYTPAGRPYALSIEAATTIAALLQDRPAAARLLADAAAVMDQGRARLHRYDGRPLCVFAFEDARHIAIAATNSLFQGVFDQLRLRNAWPGPAGEWGMAYVGIEALAAMPEARLVYLGPLPADVRQALAQSPLWRRLPPVRANRVTALPPVWGYGALPSAIRFARLLGDALASGAG